MATLYISVFADAGSTAHGDPLEEFVIASVDGTSKQSQAIASASGKPRRTVRIFSDVDAFVTWGEDPTALSTGAGGRAIGTENPEYWHIKAGDKIAVITRA